MKKGAVNVYDKIENLKNIMKEKNDEIMNKKETNYHDIVLG